MILAIDIGNTTVTLGGVRIAPQQAYSLEFTARIDINHTWSASQYESAIEQLFEDKNLSPSDFRGAPAAGRRAPFGASSFPALFHRF